MNRKIGYILFSIFIGLFSLSGKEASCKEPQGLRVKLIRVKGNHLLTHNQILDRLETRAGRILQKEVFERDVEKLLTFYENNGYPFCQIKPCEFMIEGDKVSFTLEIDEGPLVTIDGIRVVGNRITKKVVITRELRMKLPAIYDQRSINDAQERLCRLGFFEDVCPPEVHYDAEKGTGTLVIEVKEGRTNLVTGAVGYVPKAPTRKGYLTGLVDLSLKNILGTGRRIDAKWNRTDPSSSELNLMYEEPWGFGLPVNAGGMLKQRQESGYTQTAMETFLRMPISSQLAGDLTLGWEKVIPDSAGSFSMPKSRSLTGELGLRYDTRDDPLNPSEGIFYKASAKFRSRRNFPTSNFIPEKRRVYGTQYVIDLEHFFKTFRRQVLAIRLYGAETRSDEKVVPTSEKFPLGGTHSVRGYRERQFLGSRVAWINSEYRFLLSGKSRVFGFIDLGYYSDKKWEGRKVSSSKIGYGIGIRVESRIGIMGIDYGLGEGDRLMEGKIHFGLANQF